MYTPAHFKSTDLAALDRLAARDAFGTLISQVDGAPFATQLPVLYRRTGSEVALTGHWARPNPQWREIEEQRVLFIFHGPHSYVSPRWYAAPRKYVPTWNYATAHVYGRIQLVHDSPALEAIVAGLADKYESRAPQPWRLADAEPACRGMLRGIVGFELHAQDIQITLKLSQNHPAENVIGVIEALEADGSEELAALMQEALDRRG